MKNTVDLRSALPRTDAKKLVRVTGLPAVAALFAAAPDRVEKLFFDQGAKPFVGAFLRGSRARPQALSPGRLRRARACRRHYSARRHRRIGTAARDEPF